MSISWPVDVTLTLIRQRRIEQPNFEWAAHYQHNRIWTYISLQISVAHYFYASPCQCQIKWQSLKSGYENISRILNDNPDRYNVRSPNRYDRRFYDEMSDEFWISRGDYLIQIY